MVARMELKSIAGAVYVQLAYAAMFLASRLAFTKGMSHFAFVLYRQIVATLAIGLPAAYYLYRISFSQNFYYAGLALTSSTFASTMNNLIPVVTFLLAYFLKLERVRIKVWVGQAKILGTLFCVGGAMLMTFYENTTRQSQEVSQAQQLLYLDHFPLAQSLLKHVGKIHGSFLFGALLTIIGSWSMSFFMIYQAWIVREYPSQLTLSAMVSFMGCLQCALVSLLLENPSALVIQWDMQLLLIAYSGIFCTGLGFFIIMWCVKERGPVFITMFSPLSSVVVAIMEPLVLHAQLTWGSVLGMAIIIAGLYLYLWAKAQDGNPSTDQPQLTDEEEGNQAPLLAHSNS
ncbi:WAT1-related protein At2g37450-like isoform X2 [Zingiber officinale]|uniref:WAT1-related protein n=1 Tax=Zingiber officinale TaxID=94328 RepID=A0A8J5LHB1_ZINOF|nr:WAT1-related protein At2g37450-like isoform X2 [Zingiber officinale]KAG6519092.1 hypothetical protein ZIOFF_022581 [Zingiber officinale]